MKAYQIKVIVKKSKPPVWWRCVVPAGITFSTLAVILSDITGTEKSDTFLFEFFAKLHLYEANDLNPLKSSNWRYDAREASNTFIDDYFNDEKWVSFTTGSHDFRVEIEKIDNDYPLKHPILLKTTANSDGEKVFDKLKDCYIFSEGHPEFLKYSQIINSAENGVYHLFVTSNPISDENNIANSSSSILKQFANLVMQTSQSETGRSRYGVFVNQPLRYFLEHLPKAQLSVIANNLDIPDYTATSNDELIEIITNYLLDCDNLRNLLLVLSDEEISAFERAIAAPGYKPKNDRDDFDNLLWMCCAFLTSGNEILVPTDIAEVYSKINTDDFQTERRKLQWIIRISRDIVPPYYAFLPISKFCRLCKRKSEPEIKPEEVMPLFGKIPRDMNDCIVLDGNIAAEDLSDAQQYEAMKAVHSNKPFYIMKQEEIEEILTYGYPHKEIYYERLKKWLSDYLPSGKYDTDELIKNIHINIAYGYQLNDILDYFDKSGITFHKIKDAQEFLRIIQDVSNNTRTFYNCGYTPTQLAGYMYSERQQPSIIPFNNPSAQFDSIIKMPTGANTSMPQTKKAKKIRPNDPCPCGSGKKYKKCCGR